MSSTKINTNTDITFYDLDWTNMAYEQVPEFIMKGIWEQVEAKKDHLYLKAKVNWADVVKFSTYAAEIKAGLEANQYKVNIFNSFYTSKSDPKGTRPVTYVIDINWNPTTNE